MKMMKVLACFLAMLLLLSACASSAPQELQQPAGQTTQSQSTTQALSIQDVMRQTYYEMDREDYDAFYEKYGERFTYEDVDLKYVGCYDGCHVAFIASPLVMFAAVVRTEKIGEYVFMLSGPPLQVYKDGEIITLKEAYERQWVTDASMASICVDYLKAG